MILLNRIKNSVTLKNTNSRKNEQLIQIIDKLIEQDPKNSEILGDVRLDLVANIPLSSLKKEQLKKTLHEFKETKIKKKNEKERNSDKILKIKNSETFVYQVKNIVEELTNESEKFKKNLENYDSQSFEKTKNQIQNNCQIILSEILQVQYTLESQINMLQNIKTKMDMLDKQITRNDS